MGHFPYILLPILLYISYFLATTLTKKKPTTHGVKSHPLLGHLPAFLRNRHRFLDWSTELIVASPDQRMGFWIPGMRTGIVTANPADVEHVLRANFANYPKGEHATSMLRDFLGRGLFNSDGDQWLWQRKNASLQFATRSLRRFVVDVVQAEVANRLLPLLRRNNAAGGDGDAGVAVLDLQDVLERFAFDTICMVAFGHDPGCLADGGTLAEASVTPRPDTPAVGPETPGKTDEVSLNSSLSLSTLTQLSLLSFFFLHELDSFPHRPPIDLHLRPSDHRFLPQASSSPRSPPFPKPV